MNLIKKLVYSFAIIFIFLILTTFNISASCNDASIRGYTIGSDWEYVSDVTYGEKQVYGSKYYEGSLWSWMAIYKYYDSTNNEMIVMLLCTGKMQPNQKSYWDQRRWNNQEMKITFSSPSDEIPVCYYSPEATVGTITTSNSVTVSAKTNGQTAELGFSATSSTSYTTTDVTVTASQTGNTTLSIYHNFIKYKTNTSLSNICCSLVSRNNICIYKISNYNINNTYNFTVGHTSKFYRYGKFNKASVSDAYTQQFSI